ncbi:MAG: AraC family transcriptional regulator [Paraglaciecola sp.]|uniref:AraC family transcriptional regulator n=1 Tax=Paraglaciecola sp. TaxID=1920173 RepID=UPI00329688FE
MLDILTEIFSVVDLKSSRCTRLEAGGDWSFRLPQIDIIKLVTVLSGGCWMLQTDKAPVWLSVGDTFLLCHSPSYALASDPMLPPLESDSMFNWKHSNISHYNGCETVLLAASFELDTANAGLLIDALPSFFLIGTRHHLAQSLKKTIEMLSQELQTSEFGVNLIRQYLAKILLIQFLRAYSTHHSNRFNQAGWLGALGNPKIATALQLIHNQIDYKWTVAGLANAIGMSRSAFSAHFKSCVGMPPLQYLLRWRMQVARKKLIEGERVATVSETVGYASESAFGYAFRKVFNQSPTGQIKNKNKLRSDEN